MKIIDFGEATYDNTLYYSGYSKPYFNSPHREYKDDEVIFRTAEAKYKNEFY